MHATDRERQTAVARKRDAQHVETSDVAMLPSVILCVRVTHRRELHAYRINTPHVCAAVARWSGSPPLGNNSKSRVINPSPVCLPFPHPFVLLAADSCVYICTFTCLCVISSSSSSASSSTCPSLSTRSQSVSLSRARALYNTHTCTFLFARLSLSLRKMDTHVCTCMTRIVVNCSQCHDRIPTGLIEDPVEILPPIARGLPPTRPETRLNIANCRANGPRPRDPSCVDIRVRGSSFNRRKGRAFITPIDNNQHRAY